jgi:hypothetical protein
MYQGDEAAEWAALQSQTHGMSVRDSVRLTTQFLTRHALTIQFHELVLLRDRKDHQALTALRLAALAELVPAEVWPQWINDERSKQEVAVPPPLVGARSTTAPPSPLANRSSRVRDVHLN